MHARTGVSHIKSGKMDEAIAMYRDSIVPLLKQQKGFKGLYWLADRKTDKYTVLTLWETEAHMTATETSGLLQEVISKFAPYVAEQTAIDRYEVALQA
jgi:heme-degrading monooxygenase HmoA